MTEDDVVAELADGMTVGIGGWGSRRKPMSMVRAILRSPLKDLTVVSYGLMLHTALEVARKLSEEHGIEVEVVEPRTLYPLDKETILDSVKKTGKFLAVSEANLTGSFSGEIAAIVVREAFEWLDGPVMRLGAPDIPGAAFAKPMMDFFVPCSEKIEAAMLELARY